MGGKISTLALSVILVSSLIFLSAHTDENGFQGEASEYILDEEDITDGWDISKEGEKGLDRENVESGSVLELEKDGNSLTIVVIIFDTTRSADDFASQQRNTHKSYTIFSEGDLGDSSFWHSASSETYFDVRIANAYIQVYGSVQLRLLREYAERQVRKIKG